MQLSISRRCAWLLTLVGLAFALRLFVALRHASIVWPDEIFQSLEQAHRLAFGYGIIPWEFRVGARSWLLPTLLAPWMALGTMFGGGAHVAAAQAFLCAIALIPITAGSRWSGSGRPLAAVLAGSTISAVWFELVYFAPKALSEVVAAHVLVAALVVGLSPPCTHSRAQGRAAGALLALAIALRMHLAPAVLVGAWFIARREPGRHRRLLEGALPVIAAVGLLDLATWGLPFSSYWANFRFNVVEGHADDFGVLPPLAYVGMLLERWSWAGIPLLCAAAVGALRQPALAACALTVLVTHSALGHKEYRFIYPAIVLVVVLAGLGTAELVSRVAARARRSVVPLSVGAAVVWVALSAWGASRFRSVEPFERNPGQSMWTLDSAGIDAMAQLGADPGVCGVGVVNVNWAWSGGYTYLHRDIPMFLARTPEEFGQVAPGVNALLVDESIAPGLNVFVVEWCRQGMCVARRPGPCVPVPVPTISAQLAGGGA